jgi:cytochrome c556
VRLRNLTIAVLAVAIATPVIAAITPADAVRTRVSGLRELGAAFKSVNDALRSPTPQTMLIQISARQISGAARDQYNWFPAGSGPQTGVKTAAKPEIWAQSARFKQAQDAFAAQATSFQRAAQGGNLDLIRAESRKLGQTCKGCHDTFRSESK